MNLAAERVKELQFFLIDAAKRYVAFRGPALTVASELLSCAAALDYVLLLSSERPNEILDGTGAVAVGVRETTERAAVAALGFIDSMLAAPDDVFEDFIGRHVRAGGIFETFRALRDGVLSPAIAFRMVTAASDLLERRRS